MAILLVRCDQCGRVFLDKNEEYGVDESGVICQDCMNDCENKNTQSVTGVNLLLDKARASIFGC